MEQNKQGNGSDTTKWVIIIAAIAIFAVFFGFIIFSIKQTKNKPIELSSAGWVKGAASASATLTEFGDFQCPACKAYEPIVSRLYSEFDGKLKIHFKHFPLTSAHPNAMLAAISAEAAGRQDKFWEMHDWLYENQDLWALLAAAEAEAKITEGARSIKLDIDKFEKDLKDKALEDIITKSQNEGIDLGVASTPTFYINNKKIDKNPADFETFKKLIEENL